ncbi:hypothetical protein Leryth_014038 [Lithospermum erythrorhizon]|nr:hypothetical protein Leryth_014038 [Lithospermum erythrorhizon]
MGNANCSCKYSTVTVREKVNRAKSQENLQVQIEHPINDDLKPTSFSTPIIPFDAIQRRKVKLMTLKSPVGGVQANQGEDEYDDESMWTKRDNSDFDIQAYSENLIEIKENVYDTFRSDVNTQYEVRTYKDAATEDEVINKTRSGHMSDPGLDKADQFSAVPQLKQSSDPMAMGMVEVSGNLPCSNSIEEMQKLTQKMNDEILSDNDGSPLSVMTHFSADKVMIKKNSSSQILHSRNRKLWWRLIHWSHRNLHGAGAMQPTLTSNQQGDYSSETLDAKKRVESRKSSGSFTKKSMKGSYNNNDDNHSWGGFQGNAGFLPQNQWVAFPAESSTTSRVDQWVRELPVQQPQLNNDGSYHIKDGTAIPPPDVAHPKMIIPEEIVRANSVIRSLNSSTTIAHMAGIGSKVITSISCYSSLRSVNLSGNFIVHITSGSLPKGLHVLDLSRNKIITIEGSESAFTLSTQSQLQPYFSDWTRNCTSLSNCILIKELYLAGNKISEVEGLHRLLKLTILDLSFNKIITTKHSVSTKQSHSRALSAMISSERLYAVFCQSTYLSRQPSVLKCRDVHANLLKATMGDGGRSKRKNPIEGDESVLVRVTHSNMKSFSADVRVSLQMTVEAVKDKLWKKCGTCVDSMRLELYDDTDAKLADLSQDLRPFGGWLEDTSLVDKYTISDEAFAKRDGKDTANFCLSSSFNMCFSFASITHSKIL